MAIRQAEPIISLPDGLRLLNYTLAVSNSLPLYGLTIIAPASTFYRRLRIEK